MLTEAWVKFSNFFLHITESLHRVLQSERIPLSGSLLWPKAPSQSSIQKMQQSNLSRNGNVNIVFLNPKKYTVVPLASRCVPVAHGSTLSQHTAHKHTPRAVLTPPFRDKLDCHIFCTLLICLCTFLFLFFNI